MEWDVRQHPESLQLIAPLEKYSPDQPRDDHGRFGEGSEGTYGSNSAAYDKLTSGFMASPAVEEALEKYADDPANEDTNAIVDQGIKEEGMTIKSTLYRGLSFPDDDTVKSTLKSGNYLKPEGPQSTSIEHSVARDFAGLTDEVGVMLEIKPSFTGKKSTLKGLPVTSSGQSEIVLSSDTKLLVVGAPTKIGGIWHATVVAGGFHHHG